MSQTFCDWTKATYNICISIPTIYRCEKPNIPTGYYPIAFRPPEPNESYLSQRDGRVIRAMDTFCINEPRIIVVKDISHETR